MERELITYLSGFVTPRRLKRMEAALGERTRYVTVLLEDIYQPHNASAVLRSCDSCGVQDVHIVEKRNRYRVNPGVELGSSQWLSLRRYRLRSPQEEEGEQETTAPIVAGTYEGADPVGRAVTHLREQGYRIVATTPHTDDVELGSFDLAAGKVALCFGTEMEGLSSELLDQADEYLRIPMYGFVESFNISVSAAIILYTLTQRLRVGGDLPWRLDEPARQELLLAWLRRSVKESARLEARYREDRNHREGGGATA